MAENWIKILIEAHKEDLKILYTKEKTSKYVEEKLKCKLKKSTKLLWGQEKCDIVQK